MRVSEFIDGQEEKGAAFWNIMASKNDITDEELLELIGEFEEGEV